jgi:BirA family biotin operon repressor/biotin-[acetyl-CoA-carboxylase] ligase
MLKSDLLDPDKIKANLKTSRIGKKILVYSKTSSTNDIAAEYGKNKKNDGLAVFAEEQTKGRGRTGNKWLAGVSDSILCSILLTESKCSPELLSLACAVAVAETIGKVNSTQAKIKWPNDILLDGKKVAGILLESKKNKAGTIFIIGIGINCHQTKNDFPAELQKTATSIDIESRTKCDRISLAKRLLTCLDQWLEITDENPTKIINRWKKLSIQLGHRVTVVFNRRKFSGNCIGIDPERGLILQLDTGGIRIFNAAHTSIAK